LWVDLDDQPALAARAATWLNGALARRGEPRTTLLRPEWALGACFKAWDGLLNRLLASVSAVEGASGHQFD